MSTELRHPTETTLAAYAAGSLDHGLSLVIATHLSGCAACRATVELADRLGGALIEEAAPVPLSDGLLRSILSAMADDPAQETEASKPTGPTWHGLPAPLSDLLPASLDDVRWWTVAPGLRLASLEGMSLGDGIRLMRIKPGKSVPHHGHSGHEVTIVIQGAYRDDLGDFLPGDIADMDHETEHQPVAIGDQDCICIIASDAKLEFSGLTPRLLRPIIGF